MRGEPASIVVIAGTNSDGNNIGKFLDQDPDFTGLFRSGFGLEHVKEITGNTDEVEISRLFDQPPKPVNAIMEIGGDEEFHGFEKWSFKVRFSFQMKTAEIAAKVIALSGQIGSEQISTTLLADSFQFVIVKSE